MPEPRTAADDPLQNIGRALHELAQPLAAVAGLVDLLLLEVDEYHGLFREIQLISQQLEKIQEIIEEIRRTTQQATAAKVRQPEETARP